MRLLLTGAGSLVARCIHDSLMGRDGGLEIIGANLDPLDPTALRCARVHAIPPDSDPIALADALTRIVVEEQPDLVIPCRDPHIPVLAHLGEYPPLQGKVGVGSPVLARLMVDKWDAFQWCEAHRLPFAPSVLSGQPDTSDGLERMIADFGFPLIAKPRDGSGSLGVRAIRDREQLRRLVRAAGMVVQPFLTPPVAAEMELDLSAGTPLFWEIPVAQNFGGQFLVGPDGERGPSLQVFARQRLGRNEYLAPSHDPGLQQMMEAAVEILVRHGWRGPVNVQARPHEDRWFITEFGGRFSGGTSQRTWLGFDEVGWTVNRWAGREVVPGLVGPPATEVRRYLTDCPVWETPDGRSLTRQGDS